MAIRYELTQDLVTGNTLIDSEHRQLFDAINKLMDACSGGKGRDQIMSTAKFLSDYVNKHFGDEERLQVNSKYPNYQAHRQFHQQMVASVQARLSQKELCALAQALSTLHLFFTAS